MADATAYHVRDFGKVLLQVQSDLENIRSVMQDGTSDHRIKDLLEGAISKAQADIRAKADVVLHSVETHTRTLPAMPMTSQPSTSLLRSSGSTGGTLLRRTSTTQQRPFETKMTPGESMKQRNFLQTLSKPNSASARTLLKEKFGVQDGATIPRARPVGRRITGTRRRENIAPPAQVLPTINRRDPMAPLPAPTDADIRKGMLHMMNRGVIPSTADLTDLLLRKAPAVTAGPAPIHDWEEQFIRTEAITEPFSFNPSNTRVDAEPPRPTRTISRVGMNTTGQRTSLVPASVTFDVPDNHPAPERVVKPYPGDSRPPTTPVNEDPRSYNELMDQFSLHHFMIRKGLVQHTTPEFVSFKRKNVAMWPRIMMIVSALERMFAKFAVTLVYIDGHEVERLAEEDLGTPSQRELLRCVVNIDEVAPLMATIGQRYKGEKGEAAAVSKIAATWKMYVARQNFLSHYAQRAAAIAIQTMWRMYIARVNTRNAIQEARKSKEAQWRAKQELFGRQWPQIKARKRTIIHIPSLSLEEHQRMSIPFFASMQNSQMARLCNVQDENVDVIYVSPFPIPEDVAQYYQKLLQLGGVTNPDVRVKFVYPENFVKFPEHTSLTAILRYSPRCLKRIRNFIKGKQAYIVPCVMGLDEMMLSLDLDIPCFAPPPDVSMLYASKSGSKRIFNIAEVNIPPGKHDIYTEFDFYKDLAELLALHPSVRRWLFKIDDEMSGRGVAYFDTSLLPKDVITAPQEIRANLLADLLPSLVQFAHPAIYQRNWRRYITCFTQVGGVIEASPDRVIASPSANILVEPDGKVHLVSTHDQIFVKPYVFAGAAFPQTSVPAGPFRDACLAIGKACFAKNIIGHVGVDFVVYWSDEEYSQKLWAVDLNLRPTATSMSFELFNFLIRGWFDADVGAYYYLPAGAAEPERRYYTMFDGIHHPMLGTVHYNVLFGMCRSNGITFDLQEKVGTVFVLLDSFARGIISTITIAGTVNQTLRSLENDLQFVVKQLNAHKGTPSATAPKENMRPVVTVLRALLADAENLDKETTGVSRRPLVPTAASQISDSPSSLSNDPPGLGRATASSGLSWNTTQSAHGIPLNTKQVESDEEESGENTERERPQELKVET